MKRRVNKYIEARKRQQGGIVKAQSNQFRTQLRFDTPTYNFPSPDLPLSYDDFVRRMSMKEQPLTDDEYAKLRQKSAEMATQMNYYQEPTTPVGSDRMQQIQQNTMQQAQYEYYRQRLKAEEEAKRRQPAVLKQWDGISYSPTEQELNDAANRFMMNPQSAFDTGYTNLQSEVKGIPGGIDYDTYDLWNSMSKEDLENAKREWNHIKIMVGLAAGAVAGAEPIGKGISKGINKGMQFLQNPLSTTVNIGTKTIPQIGKYTWLPTTAAVGDGLYNTAMTIDGFYNLFTDNGVQKTVRLAKDGDVGGAIKSGVGDIFNIIPALSSYKYSKPIQTFIGDLKYAKRYFDHHKGNMNPIEIGYNILSLVHDKN